jgi:hypothetical protein
MEGGGSDRASVLTDLNREIGQRDDNGDRTNEFADISEIIETNTLLHAAQRAGRSAAWHRPPTAAEAPKVEARRLPRTDLNPVEGPGPIRQGSESHGQALHLLVEALVVG